MGASSSKIEEDKALRLCRERRKFVRKALDGRCSLAAAHVAYIQSLRTTGVALRKFAEPDGPPAESSLYTTSSAAAAATATPEPLALTERALSRFSSASPSVSRRADTATEAFSLTPSPPPSSTRVHTNHMRFSGSSSNKVEEKPREPVLGTVTSSSTPRRDADGRTEGFDGGSVTPGTPPWDFFGLFHPIDHQFSFRDGKDLSSGGGYEDPDVARHVREEEGIPELEDDESKASFRGGNEESSSSDSGDEFEEPATVSLVRRFENLSRARGDDFEVSAPAPQNPMLRRHRSTPTVMGPARSGSPGAGFLNGEKRNSPDLSPLRGAESMPPPPPPPPPAAVPAVRAETSKAQAKEGAFEDKVAPKDFCSSIKDIEFLFTKASESGREVPRMLEANKFHFRPIVPGKQSGSAASTLLKACFSCGDDPSQVQEEPAPTEVKYLTWHRTTSSRSSSSRNPLGANSREDMEDFTGNVFENVCMVSGSHASTLDRLYAWERKLYDEVKASEIIRGVYDAKRKILRQLESNGESSQKIDKTRAGVKDLHSRIRVSIHRIDAISQKIEELRDKELQPQLEELIEGLSRMWEVMSECHKLQFHIISIAFNHGNPKISLQSESRRQITIRLEDELIAMSSSFTKWMTAQKSYFQAINDWLIKCAPPDKDKSSKRKRRIPGPPLRNFGPPIYIVCGVWLDKVNALLVKEVTDSIKDLAAETARLLPRQEKSSDSALNGSRDEALVDFVSGFDRFRSSLVSFFGQLNNFADSSVKMYADLDKAIRNAKTNYEKFQSQLKSPSQTRPQAV